MLTKEPQYCKQMRFATVQNTTATGTLRYDTIEEFNMESEA